MQLHLRFNLIAADPPTLDECAKYMVDKVNGGKADALNAGLNMSRYPLVFAGDADSTYDQATLQLMVEPILPRFQVLEYLRAFLATRMGWAPFNALAICVGRQRPVTERRYRRGRRLPDRHDLGGHGNHDARPSPDAPAAVPYRIAFIRPSIAVRMPAGDFRVEWARK